MQSALAQWTGQRTVPNVFIGGKHIGGCDGIRHLPSHSVFVNLHTWCTLFHAIFVYFAATIALHGGGNLVPLLTEVGAVAKAETSGGAKASI